MLRIITTGGNVTLTRYAEKPSNDYAVLIALFYPTSECFDYRCLVAVLLVVLSVLLVASAACLTCTIITADRDGGQILVIGEILPVLVISMWTRFMDLTAAPGRNTKYTYFIGLEGSSAWLSYFIRLQSSSPDRFGKKYQYFCAW